MFIRKVLVSQNGHDKGAMVIPHNIFNFLGKVLSSERFWSHSKGEMIWSESMNNHHSSRNTKICEKLFWVILIKRYYRRHVY